MRTRSTSIIGLIEVLKLFVKVLHWKQTRLADQYIFSERYLVRSKKRRGLNYYIQITAMMNTSEYSFISVNLWKECMKGMLAWHLYNLLLQVCRLNNSLLYSLASWKSVELFSLCYLFMSCTMQTKLTLHTYLRF